MQKNKMALFVVSIVLDVLLPIMAMLLLMFLVFMSLTVALHFMVMIWPVIGVMMASSALGVVVTLFKYSSAVVLAYIYLSTNLPPPAECLLGACYLKLQQQQDSMNNKYQQLCQAIVAQIDLLPPIDELDVDAKFGMLNLEMQVLFLNQLFVICHNCGKVILLCEKKDLVDKIDELLNHYPSNFNFSYDKMELLLKVTAIISKFMNKQELFENQNRETLELILGIEDYHITLLDHLSSCYQDVLLGSWKNVVDKDKPIEIQGINDDMLREEFMIASQRLKEITLLLKNIPKETCNSDKSFRSA